MDGTDKEKSSSHDWCKSVIESAVKNGGSSGIIPPPPMPPTNIKLAVQSNPNTFQNNYIQYNPSSQALSKSASYQQSYPYNNMPPMQPTASHPSMASQSPLPPTMTYKSALSSNPYSLGPNSSWYSNYVPSTINTSVTPQVQVKKPNPSRFISTSPSNTQVSTSLSSQSNLKEYVTRSFAACSNAEEREYVTKELQNIISRVTSEGKMQTYNWNNELTPLQQRDLKENALSKGTTLKSPSTELESPSTKSKKRKSRWSSADQEDEESISKYMPKPIVEQKNLSNQAKKTTLSGVDSLLTPDELRMREKRANRFKSSENKYLTKEEDKKGSDKKKKKKKVNIPISSGTESSEIDLDSLKVTGTCQKLEKDYFRLTSAPDPSVVRPEHILRKSIQLIKKKWDKDEVDYVYMCSQLKSIRQDLTIQHIRNEFTVHVYETHARVALESADMNEYNQCQTQLKQLYASGIKGSSMEFLAYRILYYVYLKRNRKYAAGNSDLIYLMNDLTPEMKRDKAVRHALRIRSAFQTENYHLFLILYKETPNMGNYILDLMIDSYRVHVLQKMCRSYRPNIEVEFVINELKFDCFDIGLDFLRKAECKLEENDSIWNTKDTILNPSGVIDPNKLLL